MKFHRYRRIDANIDMTPMIDTLLQLFVVFLLSMSFTASSVPLDLPKASVANPAPQTPIAVSLDADNNLFLNQERIGPKDLPQRLQNLFEVGQKREVLLRADRKLLYEKILATITELRQAGVIHILLAYDPAEDQ